MGKNVTIYKGLRQPLATLILPLFLTFPNFAFPQTEPSELLEDVIASPIAIGSFLERVEGEAPALEGGGVFSFSDEGKVYSLIFKPNYVDNLTNGKRFGLLPSDVMKIMEVSESEVQLLNRELTLEEDPYFKSGMRLAKKDFPSFYWGNETPILTSKPPLMASRKLEDNSLESMGPVGEVAPEIEETGDVDLPEVDPKSQVFKDIPKRTVWIKDQTLWQKHSSLLLGRLKAMNIGQIFIEVAVSETENFPAQSFKLETFVKIANEADIAVWASVNGNGQTDETLKPNWVKFLKTIENYNASVGESAKIKRVQLEVKPHLIQNFSLVDFTWQANFLIFIKDLNENSTNFELFMSLPNWVPGFEGGGYLSERLPEYIDGLTIWSFRKNRLEINQLITPFLNWGERHNKPILVGVDAGNSQPNIRRTYTKANQGRILLNPVSGKYYLMFLKRNLALLNKDMYNLSALKDFPIGDASFDGDLSNLFILLPVLERDMSFFQTFSGIAISGLPDF